MRKALTGCAAVLQLENDIGEELGAVGWERQAVCLPVIVVGIVYTNKQPRGSGQQDAKNLLR